MSYTFTPNGIKLQKLINSKNWSRIFIALWRFNRLNGWDASNEKWCCIINYISDDFLASEFYGDEVGSASGEQLTQWLLSKFDFDFIVMTELGRDTLKVK